MSTDWINCNLPWSYEEQTPVLECLPMPNIEEKVKAKFGKTYNESTATCRSFFKWLGKDEEKNLTNEQKVLLATHRAFVKEYDVFVDNLPEVIEINNKNNENFKKYEEDKAKNAQSFTGKKLNLAGTQIEVDEGGTIKTYLIGNINVQGGFCDCCNIGDSVIVKRYRKLI